MPKAAAAAGCKFDHATLDDLVTNNKEWAAAMRKADPKFFDRIATSQSPEFLYIGCSDSRVPASQVLGLAPGDIFVQRNVGNQALHHDMNLMSCLEYAVKGLKVKTIMLCGHYNCGAVKAALTMPPANPGKLNVVNCWISDIREARDQAAKELAALDTDAAVARLCELNVMRQVFHVCTSPVVQSAWAEGQEVHVWGMIYDVADGHIHRLAGPLNSASDVTSLRFDGGAAPARKRAAPEPKAKAPAKKTKAAPAAKKAAPAKKAATKKAPPARRPAKA